MKRHPCSFLIPLPAWLMGKGENTPLPHISLNLSSSKVWEEAEGLREKTGGSTG